MQKTTFIKSYYNKFRTITRSSLQQQNARGKKHLKYENLTEDTLFKLLIILQNCQNLSCKEKQDVSVYIVHS